MLTRDSKETVSHKVFGLEFFSLELKFYLLKPKLKKELAKTKSFFSLEQNRASQVNIKRGVRGKNRG